MPVDDSARTDPVGEQCLPARQEAHRRVLDRRDGVAVERAAGCPAHPVEHALPARLHLVPLTSRRDLLRSLGTGVEGRENARDLANLLRPGTAVGDYRRQPAFPGHPRHHHHVLPHLAVRPVQVGHAEVGVGSKPAVELHLPVASAFALLAPGEVEKVGTDQLLDLQCPLAEQNDHADMSLVDGHVCRIQLGHLHLDLGSRGTTGLRHPSGAISGRKARWASSKPACTCSGPPSHTGSSCSTDTTPVKPPS